MTREEFSEVAAYLTAFYRIPFDGFAIKAWYAVLQDLDADIAMLAVRKLAETETNGFNINPARIRAVCGELINPQIDGPAIWPCVCEALSYGRYNYDGAMAYINGLQPTLRDVLKGIGFITLCNTNPAYLRRDVEKLYAEALKTTTSEAALSDTVKNRIGELRARVTNDMLIEAGV